MPVFEKVADSFEDMTDNIEKGGKKAFKWFKENKVFACGLGVAVVLGLYAWYKSSKTPTEDITTVAYVPMGYEGYPEMSESMLNDMSMYESMSGAGSVGSSYYDEIISDLSQKIDDMQSDTDKQISNIIESYNSEILNYNETLSYLEEKRSTEAVISQMKDNSNLWNVSTSENEKRALHEQNKSLGASIGATFEESTGTWWLNGERLYLNTNEVAGIQTPVVTPNTSTEKNKSHSTTSGSTKVGPSKTSKPATLVEGAKALNNASVVSQMQSNSSKWHNASESERKALEQANKKLGASIGATFDSGSGTWSKNGERLY